MNWVAFFVNSALAFASAELLTVALHETGHGFAAQALGFSPRIYGFFEDNPTGTAAQTLLILALGPIVSLVLGVLFLTWYRLGKAQYSFPRLLLFWLAWLGILEFVNYLIVTPWLSAGDTARIADLLHWPVWVRYLIASVGVVIVFGLARLAAISMFAVAPESVLLETSHQRRRFIMRGFYFPLLAGTALTLPAGISGHLMMVVLGLFATIGNIDLVAAALFRVSNGVAAPRSKDAPLRVEPVALLAYLAIVSFYLFVLSRGLPV